MPSTTLPVVDYTATVTDGTNSGTFTFRVRKQPASTRTIATLSTSAERFILTFLVADITSYTATTNPLTTFGVNFTAMLIKALRTLIVGGASMIPAPGAQISFGSSSFSVVDTVDIAQTTDKTVDVFLVTCNIKEEAATTYAVSDDETPKSSRSDELPPWQMPAEVTFDSQTTDGMTLGFAYPVEDLDGKKTYSNETLRKKGLGSGGLVAVENYAKDPFASPPSFPKVNGTLRVSKAFLRGGGSVDISALQGTVNASDISLSLEGAQFVFPEGTLSPTMLQVSPKLYKMPVPWLPKTKHPLGKTYGELFYGYSKTTANRIAVNRTGQIIVVNKPMRYLEVSAAFSFRPEGFAVWLANRGYRELDSASADGGKNIVDDKSGTLKEAWLTKAGKKTQNERIWRGFTMVKPSSSVESLLREFFPANNDFVWATTKDNFGGKVTQ